MFLISVKRICALLAFSVATFITGCLTPTPEPTPVCVPGETQNCACPSGATGAQTCNASGSGWGYCAGCSAGSDAGPPVCGRPGAPNLACGCWGYATEGEIVAAPYCCSGYAVQTRCTGYCSGGGSSWGNICQ